nr:glycosyltransferase family 39 protein [uncultured Ruminococcus sp.]
MTISNKISRIALAAIIVVSLCISAFYLNTKQGYHEDELLTYNLANSSKQLNIGGWNTPEDMNEYLAVYPEHRFDYAQVVQNQIIDASHPPFYYALVHTVCSFFPEVFSKWLAFVINLAMMAGALIMLFKIGKRVTDNNLYALIAVGGYALSIACITTTIYLRMYASLTFFVLTFINLTIWFYEQEKVKLWQCAVLLPVVTLGILTQYYFILCAGLAGLVYMIFSIKEKKIRNFLLYAATAVVGAGIAMAIYPHIIQNVLGGNRGLGSLNLSIDAITIVTYFFYKIGTYIQVLSKLALCTLRGRGSRLRRVHALRKKEEAAAQGVLRDYPGAGVLHRYLACVALQQRSLRHGEPAAYLDDVHLRFYPRSGLSVQKQKNPACRACLRDSRERHRLCDGSALLPLRQD